MPKLSRLDFLKLTAAALGGVALSSGPLARALADAPAQGQKPNVFIFVLDALSARHMSLHRYSRLTTPQLARFAERANVYHSHYSAGNFTTPGTASLLTGTYPSTHRAFQFSAFVQRERANNNIFNAFGSDYQRFAYCQNIGAVYLATQFSRDIDVFLPPETFSTINSLIGSKLPAADQGAAYRAYERFLTRIDQRPGLLVGGLLSRLLTGSRLNEYKSEEYTGKPIPTTDIPLYYELATVYNGIKELLGQVKRPTFGYYHLWSPHPPYYPTVKFQDYFRDDGLKPLVKPTHPGAYTKYAQEFLDSLRREYDAYIANVDDEMGKLFDDMEEKGLFENSYIVVTSDHGGLFERGEWGHWTPLLYDSILRVPLLISTPGQTLRRDVYTPTNSVDLMPTLLSLVGKPIPAWCEGRLLPGLGGSDDPARATFSVEAKLNPVFAPLKTATLAMRKGPYKLIRSQGYKEFADAFELYHLDEDPDELTDLSREFSSEMKTLRDELLTWLDEVNRPYTR